MALVKLSSKGQLVLPQDIRDTLGIGPGTLLKVRTRGRQVLLEPVTISLIDRLHGKFAGEDCLTDLEAEYQQEIRRDHSA